MNFKKNAPQNPSKMSFQNGGATKRGSLRIRSHETWLVSHSAPISRLVQRYSKDSNEPRKKRLDWSPLELLLIGVSEMHLTVTSP